MDKESTQDEPDSKEEKAEPIEVKLIKEKPEKTPYTPTDNENYADINITSEEIEEFVDSTSN